MSLGGQPATGQEEARAILSQSLWRWPSGTDPPSGGHRLRPHSSRRTLTLTPAGEVERSTLGGHRPTCASNGRVPFPPHDLCPPEEDTWPWLLQDPRHKRVRAIPRVVAAPRHSPAGRMPALSGRGTWRDGPSRCICLAPSSGLLDGWGFAVLTKRSVVGALPWRTPRTSPGRWCEGRRQWRGRPRHSPGLEEPERGLRFSKPGGVLGRR